MTEQPIQFATADQGVETARADLYGLLSALFAGPPTIELLTSIAQAPAAGEGALEAAWRDVVAAAGALLDSGTDAAAVESVRQEYERLFIGIGKPEVMLYGSFYLSGFLMEKPLAALRTDLSLLGIERVDAVVESEDHIASLCEVMRYLIAADEIGRALDRHSLAAQKQFFGTHMQSWVADMCAAVAAHPQAVFYGAVAGLAGRFFDVEMQAFEMD
ncbi:MAG: molecular chaperone TorD family protein [Herminiimonas sp.]|nr:molecular chaperone TorD family protein [Herminiimonas sp.]